MTLTAKLAAALSNLISSPAQDFATLTKASGLDPQRDFRNADLSGANLRDTDLTAFDFTNARFRGARISGARFNETVSAAQRREAILDPEPPAQPPRPDILVLGFGPRAAEILRHIETPDWYPAFGGGEDVWRFAITAKDAPAPDPADAGRIHAADGGASFFDTSGFDIVVALVDDEEALKIAEAWIAAVRSPRRKSQPLFLLAPALPRQEPSGLFRLDLDALSGFSAVVDTSVARSPFWSGNPSRSVERRVADVIVGAAMLATVVPDLLLTRTSGDPCPLLSFGFSTERVGEGHKPEPYLSLSSEEIGLLRPRETGFVTIGFRPVWHRQAVKSARWGLMFIGASGRGDVPGLLRAAAALAGNSTEHLALKAVDPPSELLQIIPPDSVAAAVRSDRSPENTPLALVVETPSLGLVRTMAGVGWKVSRYTDTSFIERALSPSSAVNGDWLPEELDLPHIGRRKQNKGLVTRGADSRDVVTLEPLLQMRVDSLAPDLYQNARRFRPAFFYDNPEPQILLSTNDIDHWLASVPQAPRDLIRELEGLRSSKPRVPKRPADLRVSWTPPPGTMQRFVIADGSSPVLVDLVHRNEVPAQSMFVVDGDSAVPALFQSRVFEVWARATASRSLSWMALRFAVTRTFETFPIEAPFTIGSTSVGGTGLVLGEAKGRLEEVCRRWLDRLIHERPYGEGRREALWSDEALQIRAELDREVLGIYSLGEDADDLTILLRLLELSRGQVWSFER